uniref:Uncharacterized protein n=1 Tax=viral metagenome TaxID=1070528 RepID=A0A6C0HQ03_9ZZZZ
MCKKLLLFLSYISLTRQMFMTSRFFSPFQNKTTNVTTQYYPSTILKKRLCEGEPSWSICDDAITMLKIWATLFVFTFPIISFPYHKDN